MPIKHFCDVCNKEVTRDQYISTFSSDTIFQTICSKCWKKAENVLIKSKKLESRRLAA